MSETKSIVEAACLVQVGALEVKEILSLLQENGYRAKQIIDEDDDDEDDGCDDDDLDEDNYVEAGQVRVRLTGSIRDTELEEAFEAAYAKHDYKLADYLRQLSETQNPVIS